MESWAVGEHPLLDNLFAVRNPRLVRKDPRILQQVRVNDSRRFQKPIAGKELKSGLQGCKRSAVSFV
jgi:hypothetical protein